MSKVKITEKDVGRRFKTRDGRIFMITRVGGSERYPVVAQEGDGAEVKGGEAVRLTTGGDYYARDAECYEKTPNDFAEWVDEDEKMENKIELKVGQKVKLRSGKTGKVVRFFKEGECFKRQPFQAYVYEDDKYWFYTEGGEWSPNGETDVNDIIEILEPEDEKMKENLKEKYEKLIGQTFLTKDDDGDDEITITYVTDSHVYFNSKRYEEEFDATFEDFEDIRIYKNKGQEASNLAPWDEEKEEEVRLPCEDDPEPEPAGKYALRVAVIDANGNVASDKSYHDSLADVGGYVFSNTRRIIDLDQPDCGYSVLRFLLRNKGDVVKNTRQINILNVNVATVIITVTQLED